MKPRVHLPKPMSVRLASYVSEARGSLAVVVVVESASKGVKRKLQSGSNDGEARSQQASSRVEQHKFKGRSCAQAQAEAAKQR